MSLSMEQYLKPVVPFTPAGLIAPQALGTILGLAGMLPPCASSGFEVRLGEPEPIADFLVNLNGADGTRPAFAGRHPDIAPPASFLESPVWLRVRDFCRGWDEPSSPLHKQVRDMWLEFDLAQLGAGVPIPGVFFGPEWESGELVETMDRSVSLLRGPGYTGLPPALSRCMRLLPGRPRIEQVGMMFSRQSDDLRLCIRGLPPRELSGYLRNAGWEGPAGEMDEIVEELLPFVDELTLDIDVGDGVRPKVGLECNLDRDPSRARWGKWLEHLVDRKLCTPTKRDGLMAWLGVSTQRDQPELWPENLVRVSQRMPGMVSGCARKVNHLKLVYQPGQPLQMKAYLAVRYLWIRITSSAPAA